MSRFIGVAILMLFIAFLIVRNDSRKTNETVERAGLMEMVEEWGAPVINMFKNILTKSELSSLARAISVKAMGKGLVPTPGNFRQYVRDTMQSSRDASVDMWGTPYVFERKGKTGYIICAGPDKKLRTADDIVEEVSLP